MIKHSSEPVCGLSGHRMTGSYITINGQKVFSPYGDYDQTPEKQQTQDERKSIQDLITEALTTSQLTPKQSQALGVLAIAFAKSSTGEISCSPFQYAAELMAGILGHDPKSYRKTFDNHLMAIGARHQGITNKEMEKQLAPLRRPREPKKSC